MHPQKTRGPKYSDVYSCVPGYGNEMYKNHFLNSMVAAVGSWTLMRPLGNAAIETAFV